MSLIFLICGAEKIQLELGNTMKLIGKRIALKAIETTQIIITNYSPKDFEVVSIGDEVTKVKVGDKIYQQFATKAEIEGQEYYLILEDDIIAIL